MKTMPPRHRTDKNTPLYRWRMANGLTQEQAAKEFGISFSTYRRLELTKVLPKLYAQAFANIKTKFPA